MVLARLPSFLRQRDHWSPCSNTSPPASSLSPVVAYHTSPSMVSSPSGFKAGFDFGLSSPTFSWGSFFGLGATSDPITPFHGLTVEEKADSPASSASSSAGQMMPFADVPIKLPAWCSEDALDHSSPEFEDVAPSSAITPSRKLRRTGRLGKTPKSASGPRFAPSSPDLEEGADFVATRSFIIDPYLHPTPANRLLRQYVSAPELSEQQQQQIMAAASASAQTPTPSGLTAASSMDDLLLELGWSGAGQQDLRPSPFAAVAGPASPAAPGRQHQPSSQSQQSQQVPRHYRAHQNSRPSSSSSAGQLSGGTCAQMEARESQQQDQQSTGGTLSEIDGSLYLRRRRQSKEIYMPAPSPLDTSTSGLSTTSLNKRPVDLQDARSAPPVGVSQQEHQRLELQQLQLQSSALQSGSAVPLSTFFNDFLQEGGDARQGDAVTGLGALDLNLGGANFNATQDHLQSPAFGQHYLLYSDTPVQTVASLNSGQVPFGYTSSYPALSAMIGGSPATARRNTLSRSRKSSTVGKNSPQQLRQQDLQPMSAGQILLSDQNATTARPSSSSLLLLPPTSQTKNIYSTPRSTQTGSGGSVKVNPMPLVPVYMPIFADPWNPAAGSHLPASTASSMSASLHPSGSASKGSLVEIHSPHRSLLMPNSAGNAASLPKQARKTGSSPNLQVRSAPLPSSPPRPTSNAIVEGGQRRIAGTRRIQSSKDLRDKARRSPDSPLSLLPALPTLGVVGGGTSAAAGFSFVNYGIEDAQELCSAVAPSGSYKIPLKGYGGLGEGGGAGPSSSSQNPSTPPRTSSLGVVGGLGHKAPSAVLKNKIRPRVKVDNSRWIQETGEDSEGDSDSEEVEEEVEVEERRGKKRRKGDEASASAAASRRNRKVNA